MWIYVQYSAYDSNVECMFSLMSTMMGTQNFVSGRGRYCLSRKLDTQNLVLKIPIYGGL